MSLAWTERVQHKRVKFNFDNLESGTMFAKFNLWRKMTGESDNQKEAKNEFVLPNNNSFDVTSCHAEQNNQCEHSVIPDKVYDANCTDEKNNKVTERTEKFDNGTDKVYDANCTDEKNNKVTERTEKFDNRTEKTERQEKLNSCLTNAEKKQIMDEETAFSVKEATSIHYERNTEEKDRDSGIDADSRGTSPQEKSIPSSCGSSPTQKESRMVSSLGRQEKSLAEKRNRSEVIVQCPEDKSSYRIKKTNNYRKNHGNRRSKTQISSSSHSDVAPQPSSDNVPVVAMETKKSDHSDCSCKRLSLPHKGQRCPFRCILEIRHCRRGQHNYYTHSSLSPALYGVLKIPYKSLSVTQDRRRPKTNDNTSTQCHESSDDSNRHMPIKNIFINKKVLNKKIVELDQMLNAMRKEREQLETVLQTVHCWSEELRTVDRTSLGVPYIRAVKNILGKQRQTMSRKRGQFLRYVTCLKETGVPGFERVYSLLLRIKKDITSIVRDERKYSAKHVENLRMLQGKIMGTCSAILSVYYEE